MTSSKYVFLVGVFKCSNPELKIHMKINSFCHGFALFSTMYVYYTFVWCKIYIQYDINIIYMCSINIHYILICLYIYTFSYTLLYVQPWQQTKKNSSRFQFNIVLNSSFTREALPSIARTMAFNIAQLMSCNNWTHRAKYPTYGRRKKQTPSQLALKGICMDMLSFPGGYGF